MPTVHTLDELYELLGCAIADVMEHPSTPPRIYNELGEFVCNLVNRPRGVGLSGAQARSFTSRMMSEPRLRRVRGNRLVMPYYAPRHSSLKSLISKQRQRRSLRDAAR
jgi:hypothetical protein